MISLRCILHMLRFDYGVTCCCFVLFNIDAFFLGLELQSYGHKQKYSYCGCGEEESKSDFRVAQGQAQAFIGPQSRAWAEHAVKRGLLDRLVLRSACIVNSAMMPSPKQCLCSLDLCNLKPKAQTRKLRLYATLCAFDQQRCGSVSAEALNRQTLSPKLKLESQS